jgi:hypothetical protein
MTYPVRKPMIPFRCEIESIEHSRKGNFCRTQSALRLWDSLSASCQGDMVLRQIHNCLGRLRCAQQPTFRSRDIVRDTRTTLVSHPKIVFSG